MSNKWFTSDFHFGHKNIIQYSNRPWTFEEQDDKLVDRWNSRVGVMDDVYHLGDFTFVGSKKANKVIELIKQLNGKITFLMGNHCQKNLWAQIEQANLPHVMEICHYKEITVEGRTVVMCHYPFETWNKAHHGAWHLHGHCHGSMAPRGRRLDVGIDNHPDHQVFSLEEIKAHMDKQDFQIVDHHTGERD